VVKNGVLGRWDPGGFPFFLEREKEKDFPIFTTAARKRGGGVGNVFSFDGGGVTGARVSG